MKVKFLRTTGNDAMQELCVSVVRQVGISKDHCDRFFDSKDLSVSNVLFGGDIAYVYLNHFGPGMTLTKST